jgi:catechol 2,3-dioxygenase-like lactoylglutathione lyase family enzyme
MDLGRFETSLDVRDIEKSLAFYKALGFRHTDGGVDIRTIGLRKGDCRLSLFQGHLQPARTQLIFWQGQVLAIARDLIGKGLKFQEGDPRTDEKGGAAAMLIDPDGHPIFFITMPVNYVNDPKYAHKSPPYRPRVLKPDMRLGWYELALNVDDIDRSLAFYGKLGFERLDDGRAAPGVAVLRNGDCRIGLYQGHLDPPAAQLVFWQGEGEAVVRDAAAKGLSLESGPTRTGDGAVTARLRDPDGHVLFFINKPGVVRGEPHGR